MFTDMVVSALGGMQLTGPNPLALGLPGCERPELARAIKPKTCRNRGSILYRPLLSSSHVSKASISVVITSVLISK